MNDEQLVSYLIEVIKKVSGIEINSDQFDKDLSELGVDSVYAIDIANAMEDFVGIVIDDRQIYKFRTINSILKFFKESR